MPSELKLQVEELQNSADQLDERDRDFASDLCRSFWSRGLSEKQAVWVERLLARARGEVQPEPEAVELPNVIEIYTMMQQAAENLRYPKVLLHTESNGDVQFSVAGDRAQHPGTINVTDGRRYGENQWFGRIHPDGRWSIPQDGVSEPIRRIVHQFALNPSGVAGEHGRASGHCCFCRKQLTDPRSMAVGYGRICAGHFGLPWGSEDDPTPEPETDEFPGDAHTESPQYYGPGEEHAEGMNQMLEDDRNDVAALAERLAKR